MKTKELTLKCCLGRINIKFICRERETLKPALRSDLNNRIHVSIVRKKATGRGDFGEGHVFSFKHWEDNETKVH